MKKEITKEELLEYKAKIRIWSEELQKYINPYPFLPIHKKLVVYAEEVLFSHRGTVQYNLATMTYTLYDKYQGTTSDPTNLKMVLKQINKIRKYRRTNYENNKNKQAMARIRKCEGLSY